MDKQIADAIAQQSVIPSHTIHPSQATYRVFEAECNFSGLDHDEMMKSLLRVYSQHMPAYLLDTDTAPDHDWTDKIPF